MKMLSQNVIMSALMNLNVYIGLLIKHIQTVCFSIHVTISRTPMLNALVEKRVALIQLHHHHPQQQPITCQQR